MRSAALPLLISVPLMLAGCASSVMTRVSGEGAGIAPPARLAFLKADEDAPAADEATAKALADALRAQGYSVADDADYLIDFALAQRPAALGITTAGSTTPISAATVRKPLQSCKDNTHRLTVTVADRKTGAMLYRGSAEEHHCKATLAESRGALIDAVVADLKKPGGARVLKRGGRE
jgi:hypothetical protein